MGQWFEKATLVDWIVLIGMGVGVAIRVADWVWKTRRAVDDTSTYATKSELAQRTLELDRDLKHWVRSQFVGYVPGEVHLDLKHRVDRIENRVERLEHEDRRHER